MYVYYLIDIILSTQGMGDTTLKTIRKIISSDINKLMHNAEVANIGI